MSNQMPLRCGAAAAMAAILFAPTLLSAQMPGGGVGAGITYERYQFGSPSTVGIDQLSLRTIPLAAHLEPARWLRLDVLGAHAEGELVRTDGSTSSISGFTDTELRATIPFGSDRTTLAVTGVVVLPTGVESQSTEEVAVAGLVAADLLPLRISTWGGGASYGLSAAAARSLGEVSVGLSAGYRVANEYEPLEEGDFTFRPGSELRVRAAIDRNVRGQSKASLHVTLFTYDGDRLNGANLYSSGNRIQVVGSYAFPLGMSGSAVAYAGMMHRSRGTVVDPLRLGALTTAADLPSQQLYLLGTGGRLPLGRHRLLPAVDLRLFRREDGVGQGYVVGVGTSAELRLSGIASDVTASSGRGVVLVPSFTFRFGELILREDAESRLTGVEIGMAIRAGGGR